MARTIGFVLLVAVGVALAEANAAPEPVDDVALQLVQSGSKKVAPRSESAMVSFMQQRAVLGSSMVSTVVSVATARVATKAGEVPAMLFIVAGIGFIFSIFAVVGMAFTEYRAICSPDGKVRSVAGEMLSNRIHGFQEKPSHLLESRFGHDAFSKQFQTNQFWSNYSGVPAQGIPQLQNQEFGIGFSSSTGESYQQFHVEVAHPLNGGRLGINLTDDDLEITSFADPSAEALGFSIGDRITSVNGRHVSGEHDFMLVLREAMHHNFSYKQPIVFAVLRCVRKAFPGGTGKSNDSFAPLSTRLFETSKHKTIEHHHLPQSPASAPNLSSPNASDITGLWSFGMNEQGYETVFSIARDSLGLMFKQRLPDGTFLTGVCRPNGPWLESSLKDHNGGYCGDVKMNYDHGQQVLIALFKMRNEDSWRSELVAHRVEEITSQPTGASWMVPLSVPLPQGSIRLG